MTADATFPGGLGTFGWDDEGVPAQRTEVVERGAVRRLPDRPRRTPAGSPCARSMTARRGPPAGTASPWCA